MQPTLGDRLRIIRKTNRFNQTEFANTIGISQATLSEIEQGKYNPSLDTILTIHKVFKADLNWLILGDQREDEHSPELFSTALDRLELEVINLFRNLKDSDRQEIIEFMKLKIKRYHQ